MRAHVIRSLVAVAILVAGAASPLFAQSLVRGRVVDGQGKPVPGATVVFVAQNVAMTREAKTDNKGEFLIVGLGSGDYKVTATMEGVGVDTQMGKVTQGQNAPITFTLKPAAPAGARVGAPTESGAENKAAAALQALAKVGAEHINAGRNDEAIAAYSELTTKVPTCVECYYNLAIAYTNKKDLANAESAYKKVIELKPDHADAYSGLANVYNGQRKFDLAAEASANAAKYSAAAPGATGANAETLFNQGVILFNAGKFAEAKVPFEAATKADPKMALAHYQLGMTALNLGDFALAVSSLEQYLVLEPNGAKAAEVKGSLPTLKGMVKK